MRQFTSPTHAGHSLSSRRDKGRQGKGMEEERGKKKRKMKEKRGRKKGERGK
jgi:hypothetical protein